MRKTLILVCLVLLAAVCAHAADNRFIYFGIPDNGPSGFWDGTLGNMKSIFNSTFPSVLSRGFGFRFTDGKKVKKAAAELGYSPEFYGAMDAGDMAALGRLTGSDYIIIPRITKNNWNRFDDGSEYVELHVYFKVFDVRMKRNISDFTYRYYNDKPASRRYTGKKEYDDFIKLMEALAGEKPEKNTFATDSLYEFIRLAARELDSAMDGTITLRVKSSLKPGSFTVKDSSKWDSFKPGDRGVIFYKHDGKPKKLGTAVIRSSKKNEIYMDIDSIYDENAAKKKQDLWFTFNVTEPLVKTVARHEADRDDIFDNDYFDDDDDADDFFDFD
ncbi:MAG: hypothetical protein ILO36_02645 [Abditibacteriota bacterium]|nr:hypothetical protein [Abditibacteriota bacterium]